MSMADDAATIRESTGHEEKEEKGEYRRRELSRGEFQRVVVLPAAMKGAEAKATFKDGILELVPQDRQGRVRHPLHAGRPFTLPRRPAWRPASVNDRSLAPLGVPMRCGAG